MSEPATASPTPITIITGFLGAGKTTLLLNLLPQLPPPPTTRLCLLKNEFGSVAVDSLLTSSTSSGNGEGSGEAAPAVAGVQELLNGCICCNLVGQLSDALSTLKSTYNPTRIVIETSGSAFPATLAMEVNRLAVETGGGYVLDGVVSVVDAENWKGYEDTSYTAEIQARYTDLVVLNKWEAVGERRVDEVIEKVRRLNEYVLIVRSERGWVSKDIIFGVEGGESISSKAIGLSSTSTPHNHPHHDHNHSSEVEVLAVTATSPQNSFLQYPKLHTLLTSASKEEIYRIKALFKTSSPPPLPPNQPSQPTSFSTTSTPAASSDTVMPSPINTYILNWAFGRWTITPLLSREGIPQEETLKMTIILARGEGNTWKKKLNMGEHFRFEGEGTTTQDEGGVGRSIEIELIA